MALTRKISTGGTVANFSTYVGEKGALFYNSATGVIRLSDGVTPGGITISVVSNNITTESIIPDTDNIYGIGTELLRWNHIHLGDGGIYFDGSSYPTPQTVPYLPGSIVASLIPYPTDSSLDLGSSTHRWGNLWIGPHSLHLQDQTTLTDVALTVDNGTLYLNGAQNLALGELTIVGNTIQSDIASRDINLGDPNDTGLFTIGRQTVITTPNLGSYTSALLINGATTLLNDPSALTYNGTLIHGVAQAGQSARIVQDAFGTGNYPIYVGRFANGTVASPTAATTNDILLRLSANGYGSSGFATGGSARIDFVATEPFTDSSKGSKIVFWTTPAGTSSITNNASVDNNGFVGNGITFTADGTRQTTAGIPLTQKGAANGVATLGADSRLSNSQIPSSLVGAIVFQGGWNASSNTPTLSNATGTTGYQYIVTTGGTQNLGAGSVTYAAGDTVTYGGGVWNRVEAVSPVSSVSANGHLSVNQTIGAVVVSSDATPNSTVSTIVSRDSSGNFAANIITANLTGNVTGNVTGSVSGNAGTVTNGVYTTGSYSDPSWLTISKSKVGLSAVENTALSTWAGSTNITTVGTLTSGTIGSGFTAIANARLANSTISGVALGGTLNALTAGFGLALESGTTYDGSAAHTINNYHAVSTPTVTGAGANGWTASIDLGTTGGVVIVGAGGNFTGTITITGTPVVGKVVRVIVTGGIKGATAVAVTGLTAANSSNGTASFAATSGTASSVVVEFWCTTTALSGVYMVTAGAK